MTESVVVDVPTKRPRGRPRKVVPTSEVPVKRPRGRPKVEVPEKGTEAYEQLVEIALRYYMQTKALNLAYYHRRRAKEATIALPTTD